MTSVSPLRIRASVATLLPTISENHDGSFTLWNIVSTGTECNNSNTTGSTCGAGTTYLSEIPEFTPSCRVARSLVYWLSKSLFVLFHMPIEYNLRHFTDKEAIQDNSTYLLYGLW
jgi:hypothetical protein